MSKPLPRKFVLLSQSDAPVVGNPTLEESKWPVVSFQQKINSTFFDEPPVIGNATAEEQNWPVISMGSDEISSSRPVPATVAVPATQPDRSWIWQLLPEVREFAVQKLRERHLEETLADDVLHDVATQTIQESPVFASLNLASRRQYLQNKIDIVVLKLRKTKNRLHPSGKSASEQAADESSLTTPLEARERALLLRSLLPKLPLKQAELLDLHFLQGRTLAQLEMALGRTSSELRNDLRAAKQSMRQLIDFELHEFLDLEE